MLHSRTPDHRKEKAMIGIVKEGRFQSFTPPSPNRPSRLTAMQMQEAASPEGQEIDLSMYEGQAIMVDGAGSGGEWIYSARVVDVAGPILTEVVKHVFALS
jgi:hypothetical protein